MFEEILFMDLIEIVGWIGAVMLLIAYTLNITKKLSNDSNVFLWVNFFGGALLVINAYFNKVYPFLIVNLFWVIFSAMQLVKPTPKEVNSQN